MIDPPAANARPSALAGVLVTCFASLCLALTAIGLVSLSGLRSIEKLNEQERSTLAHAITLPQRLDQYLNQEQSAVLRHATAATEEERRRLENVIAHAGEASATSLAEFQATTQAESVATLGREAREASAAYASATARLLALSRGGNRGDAASFALTTQTPVYERYQAAIDALLRFDQAGGRKETATIARSSSASTASSARKNSICRTRSSNWSRRNAPSAKKRLAIGCWSIICPTRSSSSAQTSSCS